MYGGNSVSGISEGEDGALIAALCDKAANGVTKNSRKRTVRGRGEERR